MNKQIQAGWADKSRLDGQVNPGWMGKMKGDKVKNNPHSLLSTFHSLKKE